MTCLEFHIKFHIAMAFANAIKCIAPPGNRTRVARMGILHDTTTPAVHTIAYVVLSQLCINSQYRRFNTDMIRAAQTFCLGLKQHYINSKSLKPTQTKLPESNAD